MPYTKTAWVNGIAPAINATNLNKIENALYSNSVFYNVKDPAYGAVGDGVANDAPAIQNAINDAATAGGGVVYVPGGIYLLNTSILMKTAVSLIGVGPKRSVLKANFTGAALVKQNAASTTDWSVEMLGFDPAERESNGGQPFGGCLAQAYQLLYALVLLSTNGINRRDEERGGRCGRQCGVTQRLGARAACHHAVEMGRQALVIVAQQAERSAPRDDVALTHVDQRVHGLEVPPNDAWNHGARPRRLCRLLACHGSHPCIVSRMRDEAPSSARNGGTEAPGAGPTTHAARRPVSDAASHIA